MLRHGALDAEVASAKRALEPSATARVDTKDASIVERLFAIAGCLDRFGTTNDTLDVSSALRDNRELTAILAGAVTCLVELETLHGDDAPEFELEAEPPTVDGLRIMVPTLPPLADVCFAARLELKRSALQLAQVTSLEDALAAQESALRKLRRAIRAVCDVAGESGIHCARGAEQLRQRRGTDLAEALAVRRLYAEFRRSLRRPETESAEAVLVALRYAAGALSTLVSSPAYAAARVTDRALLRRLHERLVTWARSGKTTEQGLELLDDIRTSAELLRNINRRQELREHDAMLVRELAAGPGPELEAWRQRLFELFGLDESLDGLIDRLARHERRPPVEEVVRRLQGLR